MTTLEQASPDIESLVRRRLLCTALRNATRGVWMLLVAMGLVAALGWMAGRPLAAAGAATVGGIAALLRRSLARRHADTPPATDAEMARVARWLDATAIAVGMMWAVCTVAVYPGLDEQARTLYLVMVCGSIAYSAQFMAMASRSFAWLTTLQIGAICAVSLLVEPVRSLPLALLAPIYGLAMLNAARELRLTIAESLRRGLEAEAANVSLQRAKQAADAASISKSQFLATMSHEMRTPMNGILGALDLMRDTPLDKRQRSLVRTAVASGESLLCIIDDVLDHSTIESGKLKLGPAPMSVHAVAASAAALLRSTAEQRGLKVELQIAPEVPDAVIGDASRLKQVLLNLIGNGIKFTERGGVTLRLTPAAAPEGRRGVHFEVADTGIGIPADAIARLFQPFSQVDATRSRSHGGTGLGLAISQRIIEAMGGHIGVESTEGRGSSFGFTLALPPAPEPVPLHPPMLDSGLMPLAPAPALHGRVLLVEDNPVNRLIAAEMLKTFSLDVVEAEDGQQALERIDREHFDLVLMDIQMPVLDGYAATQRIREREARLRLARVPIVALTANAFDEDAAQSLAVGMDAHLSKPYSREQLRTLLKQWL
ncbi:hybrid sensor histidine kinase/response regulator [Rubrivivax gelatinosus]|nr:hybrid sensor histidine kinase/response regulator [Rubrivivax gelatinosus]